MARWSLSLSQQLSLLLLLVALTLAPPAQAADPDLDALSLQSAAPAQAPAAAPTKLFVEAAVGVADQRYGGGSREIGRLTLDARHSGALGDALRYALSARLDTTHPADSTIDNPVFSLREAFVSWQDAADVNLVDVGRVNLRNGPAYGYNPTDFFRDDALRTITSVNPFTLRENRLGTAMIRGQHLWVDGSASLALAPELTSRRSSDGLSADWGATNSRQRALATLDQRWSGAFSSQLLIYKEQGSSLRWGATATALLSDAVTAHAEVERGREPDLLARATGLSAPQATRNRLAAGLTYTTANRLSLTAEAQYNGFALDRDAVRSLPAIDPALPGAYFLAAQSLQDNAARQAVLLFLTQGDLIIKNLDLTTLVKFNRTDGSRLVWLDLRYRLDKIDLALQAQRHFGSAVSEFGILPVRGSFGLVATAYF